MRGLVVAAACVCLLAGCAPVPAATPPVGLSTEEAESRRVFSNQEWWLRISPPGTPMPEVTPVAYVNAAAAEDRSLGCFTQATGIPSINYNELTLTWQGPNGEPLSSAQNRMLFICTLEYPIDLSDPAAAGLYSPEERSWAWTYQQTRLTPCLQLMGFAVDNREGGYIPSSAWWSPYDEITPAPTASEWKRIDDKCPPSPYGPTR
jgi:hypothetical protein